MTRKLTLPIFTLLVAAMVPLASSAQGFYDDDIYDTGKKKTTTVKTTKNAKSSTSATNQIPSLSGTGFYYGGDGNIYPEYDAADTYSYSTGNLRDVDEYNRRGIFGNAVVDSIPADSLADYFAYTRRLEKFHNPEVVSGSADTDLQAYYYDSQYQTPTTVNVYVNSPYYNPWGWNSYYSPWYSWNFSWGYRPWGWSWGWGGYDPYWDWAWGGPSWSWGWGPSWGWGGPSWGWAPPARPVYNTGIGSSGTRRPLMGQTRPGSGTVHAGRPSNGNLNVGAVGQRPGASVARPGGSTTIGSGSSGQRPGASVTRPGYIQNQRPSNISVSNGSRPGVTTRPANSSFNNNNQGSRPTYSRPASSGGSRSTGSSGGSRTGSGGGGSRGTRR